MFLFLIYLICFGEIYLDSNEILYNTDWNM